MIRLLFSNIIGILFIISCTKNNELSKEEISKKINGNWKSEIIPTTKNDSDYVLEQFFLEVGNITTNYQSQLKVMYFDENNKIINVALFSGNWDYTTYGQGSLISLSDEDKEIRFLWNNHQYYHGLDSLLYSELNIPCNGHGCDVEYFGFPSKNPIFTYAEIKNNLFHIYISQIKVELEKIENNQNR